MAAHEKWQHLDVMISVFHIIYFPVIVTNAALRTVMDHCAPATRVGVFALLNHLSTAPPGPGLTVEWDANYGR